MSDKKVIQGTIIKTLVIIGAIALAIFAGSIIGKKISASRMESYKKEMTKNVLKRMQTIKVGDVLPDHEFEYLDESHVMLSDLLSEKTAIIFISPTCHTCLDEITHLLSEIQDKEALKHFVFVSADNPRLLKELRDENGLSSPVLYDHRRAFTSQFAIETYPFNLIINKNRQIEDIVVGELGEKEIKEIIQSNNK